MRSNEGLVWPARRRRSHTTSDKVRAKAAEYAALQTLARVRCCQTREAPGVLRIPQVSTTFNVTKQIQDRVSALPFAFGYFSGYPSTEGLSDETCAAYGWYS